MRKLTPAIHGWHQKLVSQIVAGKFIELNKLLSTNLVLNKPKPQLLFDGQLVLNSTPKKLKQCVDDITNSLEAFSVWCYLILPFPASLERFVAISAVHPSDTLPGYWLSLVSIGLGFSRTRCCHKPYRLVNHQCAVQRLILLPMSK